MPKGAFWRRWFPGGKKARPRRALFGNLISQMESRLQERPSDLRLRLSLISHLRKAGRYEEAIQQARNVLQLEPGNRQAKSFLLQLRLERRLAELAHGSS